MRNVILCFIVIVQNCWVFLSSGKKIGYYRH